MPSVYPTVYPVSLGGQYSWTSRSRKTVVEVLVYWSRAAGSFQDSAYLNNRVRRITELTITIRVPRGFSAAAPRARGIQAARGQSLIYSPFPPRGGAGGGRPAGVWRRHAGVAHHTPATASPVEADVDSIGRSSPRGRRRARRALASQSERSQRPVPPSASPPPPQHAAAAPPGPPAAPAASLAAPAHPKGLSERQRWPPR